MTTYQITLTTLSPLHIGDGQELRQGFDFVVRHTTTPNGKITHTCCLDENALLEAKAGQIRPDQSGNYPIPERLLTDQDIQSGQFFRYILRGQPRSAKVDARIRSMIKDVESIPYIPGSSLKGAIRTGLAWSGFREVIPQWNRSDIGNRKEWAGQDIEHRLFGRNPNYDIMRAIQVSDLFPVEDIAKNMAVLNIQVMTRRALAAPIEVEAILAGAVFKGTIKVDDTLFSSQMEPVLQFSKRKKWLDELMPRLQRHSQHRIDQLLAWFTNAQNGERLAEFYSKLTPINTGAQRAAIQLGWGAGWDAKTFGDHLQTNPELFERLVSDFRMNKTGPGGRGRHAGDPFPKSKRTMILVERDRDGRPVIIPARPMGWVLIELTEVPHA